MTKKISIITVCYNSDKTIRETFESLLNQTDKEFEYYIIDGKSTDNTIEIIKEYQSIFREAGIDFKFISEKDNGLYDAMNKGISLVSGEVIGILNSDDYYEKNTIEIIKKYYVEEEELIIHGNINFLLHNNRKLLKKPKRIDPKFLKNGMIFFHPTFFVSKKVYLKVGKFRTSLKVAADFDFVYRCYKNNISFKYIDETLTNFRIGGESTKYSDIGFNECKNILIENKNNKIYINFIFLYKKIKTKLFYYFLEKGEYNI